MIIIFLNSSFENRELKEKIVAVFVIIGSINLPIIKFSVDWWNTLHQPASISKLSAPSIDPAMLRPLLIMTAAFILIGLLSFKDYGISIDEWEIRVNGFVNLKYIRYLIYRYNCNNIYGKNKFK